MLNVGVLVSGGGTNLQAIIDSIESGRLLSAKIAVVVSSNEKAYALERAKNHGIPALSVSKAKLNLSQSDYDEALIKIMSSYSVDLIVLAGFMSMLGEGFIKKYENRIINIHPSLIPSFCGKGCYGKEPHRRAIERGVKLTGATVHFVNNEYDAGPIIIQKAVDVLDDDTPESLQARVMKEAEWIVLPEAIRLISEGKVKVENGRAKIYE